MSNTVWISTQGSSDLTGFIDRVLPTGDFRKIFIKPNWVRHSESPEFPINAVITSPEVIEQVIRSCLRRYPNVESIMVGDVPLQSCDWDLLKKQSGLDSMTSKFSGMTSPTIQFVDLRREKWQCVNGFLELLESSVADPIGYTLVELGKDSLLEEVSDKASLFRVSDYDPTETRSAHTPGNHRYLVCRSMLEADLFINLPKMKTHQKCGITGALKNLVGINANKAYLVHHRIGFPCNGGDEFSGPKDLIFYLQVRMRELLQKRSRSAFLMASWIWKGLKAAAGIQTHASRSALVQGNLYRGSGSWPGNDSIWRMVYDLNKLLLCARPEGGMLDDTPRRKIITIIDGLIAGEGNGPLQPLPVIANTLIASENPFVADWAMAKLMGFEPYKIPLLAKHKHFSGSHYDFDPKKCSIHIDDRTLSAMNEIEAVHAFLPPPAWVGSVEAAKPE